MSSSHYLINYSKKEFCKFNNKIPIFQILNTYLNIHNHWKITDDIRIDCEWSSDSLLLLMHLSNDLEFKNLDFYSSEYINDFISSKNLFF